MQRQSASSIDDRSGADRHEPIDQSNAVLYLASDEARLVTSTTFHVDAGVTQY